MDISEAEPGVGKMEIAALSLRDLIEDAVDAYSEFALERRVVIALEIPADLGVNGDATALFRVFANLLDNPIKYTPPDGRVSVTARPGGRLIEVEIRDTGVGISADDFPRIWERLFRGDRSRSERGLGLGLSFVRAIVVAHGGSVSAASRPGEGTTISLSLPSAAA